MAHLSKSEAFDFLALGAKYNLSPRDLAGLYELVGPEEWKKYLSESFSVHIYLEDLDVSKFDFAMDLSWPLYEECYKNGHYIIPNRRRSKKYLELELKESQGGPYLVFDKWVLFTPDQDSYTIRLEDCKPEYLFLLDMGNSISNNPNFCYMISQGIPQAITDARRELMRTE